MINLKYIDKICDANFKSTKYICWQDKFGRKWTNIIYNDIITDYLISNYGDVYNLKYNRMCPRREDLSGYTLCNIYINGKIYVIRINRAVMLAFHPIENAEKYVVNHLNGNKLDNYEDNLEWTTHYGNKIHAIENNLINPESEKSINHNKILEDKMIRERLIYDLYLSGMSVDTIHKSTGIKKNIITRIANDNSSSKYTEHDIRLVCELLVAGISQKKISEITSVSYREIRRIVNGESWSYIFAEYKDKIKFNQRVPTEIKNKVQELIDDGKSYLEMIKILNIEDCRHSRYLYEIARKNLKNKQNLEK